MTYQEAIARIKEHIRIHKLCEPRAIKISDVLDIAISALEKQIPKQPIMIQNRYSKSLHYLDCPSCGNYIGIWNSRLGHGDMYNNSNKNICPYCGQAIDWRGE